MNATSDRRVYTVYRAATPPGGTGAWDGPVWSAAPVLQVDSFRPESSDHRPRTRARVLLDDAAIHVIFRVQDRYVRCVRTAYQASVCKDSCVEFFVEPAAGRGYFNFEFNCGGTFLCYHVRDPQRQADGFRDHSALPEADGRTVRIYHSLPRTVEPEIERDTEWTLEAAIPLAVFERHVGPVDTSAGAVWRANFYKCGDETSHPHWASWSPVDEKNFHLPHCFGELHIDGALPEAGS